MDRTQDAALLVGRLLMAALFLPGGIAKALAFSAFAASLADKGLPFPEVWAAAAVLIEVLAPVALIAGVLPRTSALLLFAFTVVATATSHRYWEYAEPARRQVVLPLPAARANAKSSTSSPKSRWITAKNGSKSLRKAGE